jgi:hypothetical protein
MPAQSLRVHARSGSLAGEVVDGALYIRKESLLKMLKSCGYADPEAIALAVPEVVAPKETAGVPHRNGGALPQLPDEVSPAISPNGGLKSWPNSAPSANCSPRRSAVPRLLAYNAPKSGSQSPLPPDKQRRQYKRRTKQRAGRPPNGSGAYNTRARPAHLLCLSKNPSDTKVGQLFEGDARVGPIKEAGGRKAEVQPPVTTTLLGG